MIIRVNFVSGKYVLHSSNVHIHFHVHFHIVRLTSHSRFPFWVVDPKTNARLDICRLQQHDNKSQARARINSEVGAEMDIASECVLVWFS